MGQPPLSLISGYRTHLGSRKLAIKNDGRKNVLDSKPASIIARSTSFFAAEVLLYEGVLENVDSSIKL